MIDLSTRLFDNRKVYYRPGTSDERVLEEVITKATYRRKKPGFDVFAGEHWLDLGANIGAFAVYCALRGATAHCYEPDPQCFAILSKNAPKGFVLKQAAVTIFQSGKPVTLHHSPRRGEHYRGTIYPRRGYDKRAVSVPNVNVAELSKLKVDGIKMDIEGAERMLILSKKLPKANKLCMEYHTSVDTNLDTFFNCIEELRKHYNNIKYPAEFDVARKNKQKEIKTWVDRNVFAWRS